MAPTGAPDILICLNWSDRSLLRKPLFRFSLMSRHSRRAATVAPNHYNMTNAIHAMHTTHTQKSNQTQNSKKFPLILGSLGGKKILWLFKGLLEIFCMFLVHICTFSISVYIQSASRIKMSENFTSSGMTSKTTSKVLLET